MLSGMKGSGTALLKQRYSWEQAKQTEHSAGWEKLLKVVLGSYGKGRTLLEKQVGRRVEPDPTAERGDWKGYEPNRV